MVKCELGVSASELYDNIQVKNVDEMGTGGLEEMLGGGILICVVMGLKVNGRGNVRRGVEGRWMVPLSSAASYRNW